MTGSGRGRGSTRPLRGWALHRAIRQEINHACALLITGVLAPVLLLFGIATTVQGLWIATDGGVVRGEVVDARYGSKADFVWVHLDQPVDREVKLWAWSRRPPVGSVMQVRYRRSDPDLAIDARMRMPWSRLAFSLAVACSPHWRS